MPRQCLCATNGCRARVFHPTGWILAVGTLKIESDCVGTFEPDLKFLRPTFRLNFAPYRVMLAESGIKMYELHNWHVDRFLVGAEEVLFQFTAVCGANCSPIDAEPLASRVTLTTAKDPDAWPAQESDVHEASL